MTTSLNFHRRIEWMIECVADRECFALYTDELKTKIVGGEYSEAFKS